MNRTTITTVTTLVRDEIRVSGTELLEILRDKWQDIPETADLIGADMQWSDLDDELLIQWRKETSTTDTVEIDSGKPPFNQDEVPF